MGVGFRAPEGGELGVVSSHSSWVKAKIFSHCFRCHGGECVRVEYGGTTGVLDNRNILNRINKTKGRSSIDIRFYPIHQGKIRLKNGK